VKKKVVSEVLRKYGVCVCVCVCVCEGDFSDTTMLRHKSTNLEAEISCAYIGSKTEM